MLAQAGMGVAPTETDSASTSASSSSDPSKAPSIESEGDSSSTEEESGKPGGFDLRSKSGFVDHVQWQLAEAVAQHGPMVASVLSQQLAAAIPADRETKSQWFYSFDAAQRLLSQHNSLASYSNLCRATAAGITALPKGHLLRLLLTVEHSN